MADRSEWARRVAQWRRSGQTAAEFCVGRGFAASTLLWNSSRLGKEGGGMSLVRVDRAPAHTDRAVVIEIADVRVHVPSGADVATLRSVLEAVREATQ